jgi:hypothetical protein
MRSPLASLSSSITSHSDVRDASGRRAEFLLDATAVAL